MYVCMYVTEKKSVRHVVLLSCRAKNTCQTFNFLEDKNWKALQLLISHLPFGGLSSRLFYILRLKIWDFAVS